MDYMIEIDEFALAPRFVVYFNDDDYKAETLAEAFLYVAKRFQELGLDELQKRINQL